MCQQYGGELLIINLVFLEPRSPTDSLPVSINGLPMPTDPLSVPDVEHIIRELKPRVAILTHFGISFWRAKPGQIARRLSEKTGVKVIAARDGMKFELSELDSC